MTTVPDGVYEGFRKGSPEPDVVLVKDGFVYEFGVGNDWKEHLTEMKWRIGEKLLDYPLTIGGF